MGFPTIQATATDSGVSVATPLVVPLPSGIVAGNLLFGMLANDESAGQDLTWPAGWTKLHDTHFADIGLTCAWRIADGSEGATISIALATATTNFAWICDRIAGAIGTGTPVAVGTMPAQANTASPNPPTLSPGWTEDTLWYAIGVTDQNSVGITSYPANYSSNQALVSGAANGIARATRDLNAASENPGTFTFSVANAASAQTAAIRPQAFVPGFQSSVIG